MTTAQATGLSDKDLIINILNNFFIVDYGYINKVNPDKTVNITHAVKPVLLDGTELSETTTDNVEVLTISGAGFSINWDYKANDKVLILGLKDYVPKVNNVKKAEVPKSFIHYDRSTIKCIPLCIFNSEAKAKIEIKDGTIAINGNSKHFVTWEDLNTALNTFLGLLNTHTHSAGGSGTPTTPMTINIASAKTKTIVTGG